jgi:hypothetical protein
MESSGFITALRILEGGMEMVCPHKDTCHLQLYEMSQRLHCRLGRVVGQKLDLLHGVRQCHGSFGVANATDPGRRPLWVAGTIPSIDYNL